MWIGSYGGGRNLPASFCSVLVVKPDGKAMYMNWFVLCHGRFRHILDTKKATIIWVKHITMKCLQAQLYVRPQSNLLILQQALGARALPTTT